jgi:hypothetical protein
VKLEIVSGTPTADEMAAIVAAVQLIVSKQKSEQSPSSRWRRAGRDFGARRHEFHGWNESAAPSEAMSRRRSAE